jgi:3-hydroxy-9,10-secoandrosta-1,3,5(10)-triene-9,17-dione monooxygenase
MQAATQTATKNSGPSVSREELLRRAEKLVPVLRERAARCEELRRVPDETVADFRDAQIHRISQPAMYGGLGFDMDTVYEVAAVLGRGCGSSAWMGGFWPLHNWMVGMWPKETQDEYWANSFDVLSSTASAMVGSKTEPAKGGLRLSGRWNFASGIDHAEWVQLILTGPSEAKLILIPKSDYRIEDNWYVSGLRGSGSKGISIEDAFVPEHRILDGALFLTGRSHGRHLHGNPFYKLPLFGFIGYSLAASIIGMGQGTVDLFEEEMRGRFDGQNGQPVIEQTAKQMRLAESSAEVDAARLLMMRDLAELRRYGETETEPPLDVRMRVRRDITYAVKISVRAANRLFEGAGGHAIYDSSPLQRVVRDINAASHSIAVAWDVPAENYGRVRWGLEPNTWQF